MAATIATVMFAIVAVIMLLLAVPNEVLAEKTPDVLTSNIKQAMTSTSDRSKDHAQEFTTGAHSSGYGLTSLDIAFANATLTGGGVANQPEVSIWVRNTHPELFEVNNRVRWIRLARWDRPSAGAAPSNGEFTFSYDLPQHLHLEPSTVYRVAVGKDSSMSMAITKYVADSGSPGWLVGNRLKTREGFNEYTNTSHDSNGQPAVGKISLHGYPSNPTKAIMNCAYKCRVLPNGDWAIAMIENHAQGELITEIGLIDDLDATVGGADKSYRMWIEYPPEEAIDDYVLSVNRFLFSSVTFDYETQQEHNFVIKVYDLHEHITTTQKVVLVITNISDEPVSMTGATKLVEKDSAVVGKRDVTVCWTNPHNVGRPTITDYYIRYRVDSSSGEWTEISRTPGDQCRDSAGVLVHLPVAGTDDVEGIGHTIVGLDPNTVYSIEIRANNSAGSGPWGELAQFSTHGVTAQRKAEPTATPEPTAMPPEPSLTAEFRNIPASHNGSDPVVVELYFSENVPGLSYKTLKDSAFQTTNAGVINASRLVAGSNQGWSIRLGPTNDEPITIVLPQTTNCSSVGAVCLPDGKRLHNSLKLIIPSRK